MEPHRHISATSYKIKLSFLRKFNKSVLFSPSDDMTFITIFQHTCKHLMRPRTEAVTRGVNYLEDVQGMMQELAI